jgi:VIT1/CCC1 family predicted Fe2+/Mn2+ transporter
VRLPDEPLRTGVLLVAVGTVLGAIAAFWLRASGHSAEAARRVVIAVLGVAFLWYVIRRLDQQSR